MQIDGQMDTLQKTDTLLITAKHFPADDQGGFQAYFLIISLWDGKRVGGWTWDAKYKIVCLHPHLEFCECYLEGVSKRS